MSRYYGSSTSWEVAAVRGRHDPQVTMLAFIDLETRVPPDHPLRVIKKLADQALKALSPDLDRMYADVGRPLRLRSGQAFDSS